MTEDRSVKDAAGIKIRALVNGRSTISYGFT